MASRLGWTDPRLLPPFSDVVRVLAGLLQDARFRGDLGVTLSEIAVAFACRPRVLLLDEPAAGVPEAERQEILATIAALPADVTVLLIEHDMDIVFSFADRISVLVNGELFVEGPPDEVARDPRVKAVYLGEALDG